MKQTKVIPSRKKQEQFTDEDNRPLLEQDTPLFSGIAMSATILPFEPERRVTVQTTTLFEMPRPNCSLCKDSGIVVINGRAVKCSCGGKR